MNKFMKSVVLLCCTSILLTGCAGRAAHPIHVNQPGDSTRTCSSIDAEMAEIQGNINRLLPKESKTGKNVALGVVGLVVWPAWFFMDFSDAERIEIEAYRSRYNNLARIHNDKRCGQEVQEIPEFVKKSKSHSK